MVYSVCERICVVVDHLPRKGTMLICSVREKYYSCNIIIPAGSGLSKFDASLGYELGVGSDTREPFENSCSYLLASKESRKSRSRIFNDYAAL